MTVDGNLYAEVDQLALARAAYRIPAPLDAILDCRCLISGIRRTPHPDFGIAWHEQDILDITIENYYDFKVPVPLPDELFALSRKGKDKVSGTLARNKDGTYSGIMHASSGGTANGMAFLGLAGVAECSTPDVASADQDLFVVGEKVGLVSLLLRFYPASTPVGTFTNCQAKIEFAGDPKAGQPAGYYLPLNDTRWQQPAIGIEIPIPSFIGNVIDQYEDRYLYQLENDLCSVFYITVIWPDPKAARAPTAGPPRTTHLCQ